MPTVAKRTEESETTALVAKGEFGSLRETLETNLAGERLSPFDLERVRVPSGGGTFWTIHDASNPDGKPVASVSGVIVGSRLARSWWSVPMGEGGNATPDCSSADNVLGVGSPGGKCDDCPNAQWGSAGPGRKGQACKLSRLLFVVSNDSMLPRVVVVPPGSLKTIKNYMAMLTGINRPYWSVVTKFSLEKVSTRDNKVFSRIKPELERTLAQAEVGEVRDFSAAMNSLFSQVTVSKVDMDGGDE